MTKLISLVIAGLLLASPALAAEKQVNAQNQGPFQVVSLSTASLATNAIDTTNVRTILDIDYKESGIFAAVDTTAADIYWLWPLETTVQGLSGTGGSGTVDSVQVAVDVSSDGIHWTQASALGNLMTNAAPKAAQVIKFHSNQAAGLKQPPMYVRFRLKNTGAATGKAVVTAKWLRNP